MTDRTDHARSTGVDAPENNHGTDLPEFSPYQTFIVRNIDKSVNPEDLKKFLYPDVKKQPYLTVHMPSDKLGNTKGMAFVTAPKTYTRQIMEFDGMSSKTQRKKLVITKQEGTKVSLKTAKWIKTDTGVIYSQMEMAETCKEAPDREINMQYCLIDSGACLTHDDFTSKKDIDSVIERAYLSGVEKIVIKCVNVRKAWKAQKLSSLYPGILYFTAGVTSTQLKSWKGETTLSYLRDLLSDPQCVAVGEIGLDMYTGIDEPESVKKQIEMFTDQVSLACEFGKPLVVKVRGMTEKMMDIFSQFEKSLPPVCVSVSYQKEKHLEMYLQKGFYLALTGYQWEDTPPTWMTNWLKQISEHLDSVRIMLASESPDCFPGLLRKCGGVSKQYMKAVHKQTVQNYTENCGYVSMKYCSSRNEPLSLHSLVEFVSGSAFTTPNRLAALTRKNAYQFFNFQESDKKRHEAPQVSKPMLNEPKRTHISAKLLFFIGVLPVLFLLAYEMFVKM